MKTIYANSSIDKFNHIKHIKLPVQILHLFAVAAAVNPVQ